MTTGTNWGNTDWFGTKSRTQREITLTTFKTNQILTLWVEVTTKVIDIKYMLCGKMGIEPTDMKFIVKHSSSYRVMYDNEEVPTKVTIKGIRGYEREKAKYPFPHCVIGGGHNGLRQALSYYKEGIHDYVLYDRNHAVGGNAWVKNANPTSKLQTELGVYHLQYDRAFPIPMHVGTWPSRGKLLAHFKETCEEYGILANTQLNTEVTECKVIINNKDLPFHMPEKQQMDVVTTKLDTKTEDEAEMTFSTVSFYPGALTLPNKIEFKGEDVFEGVIAYGMTDGFPYEKVRGSIPAVFGFGAFGVENVRTCVEHGAKKILLVCRRKNISCPRCVSWWINQSFYPVGGAMLMTALEKAYNLMFEGKGDDVWDYYAVIANKDRTVCTLRQKSRFGIGDIYFLSSYYGKTELIVDFPKRVKPHQIIFEGGAIRDVDHMIKCYGYKADDMVDKVMSIKEMQGFFVNGDWRRWVCTEFHGLDAGKFGGTSLSPGAIANADAYSWFINYPKDLGPLFDLGPMGLPRQKAKKDECKPAYYYDPRTGSSIGMILGGGVIPGLAEKGGDYGQLNRDKMLEAHPLETFQDEAEAEWVSYCEMFKKEGDDRPFPPYPYSKEYLRELVRMNDEEGEADAAKQAARMAGQ